MKIKIGLLLLLLLAACAAVWWRFPGLLGGPPPPARPEVSAKRTEQWVQGVGYVEPVSEVRRLTFKGNGVIGECRVRIGDEVRRGDVLMTLGNGEEKAALAVAEQELAVARAARAKVLSGINPFQIAAAEHKVEGLKEQLDHARKEYERSRALAGTKALSDSEHDRVRTAKAQAEAALRQAEAALLHLKNHVTAEDRELTEAEVRLAAARVEWRRRQLEDTYLRAPSDGCVLEVLKHEGEGVRLADNEPVLLLADLSRLRIRVEIEERFARRLRVGQRAVVFGRGLGKDSFESRVVLVKAVMGKKTVFARTATERKDLDVLQVFIEPEAAFQAPVGLEVDVRIALEE